MHLNRPYSGTALQGEALTQAIEVLGSDQIEAYLPDAGLVEAVNLAIFLKRPLLLKGEPGCGKTRLARALAWELYGAEYGTDFEQFYFEWHIKSTAKAREGFYRYDHMGRLRDHHLQQEQPAPAYVKLGEIGRAFLQAPRERPVILIDEIDKADIDFPNDLLRELERYEFAIEELSPSDFSEPWRDPGDPDAPEINYLNQASSTHPPIIIITSNDEKELPEAFLRRCIFYYIDFPDQIKDGADRLKEIVLSHFQHTQLPEPAINQAIKRFRHLRKLIKSDPDQSKNVSTSELIDWFRVLDSYHDQEESLAQLQGKLPFAAVLLKGMKAHDRWLVAPVEEDQPDLT